MSSLRWAVCWVAAGMFTVAPSVQAAEEVGKAVLIRTAVTGQNGPLAEQAPVHRDERIKTSQSGLGQFVFRDGTKLAVGWGSSVVIDKYVFNDDASVKQLSIKAVKGTFRWISGKSKSSAYSIVDSRRHHRRARHRLRLLCQSRRHHGDGVARRQSELLRQ